MPTRRPTSLGWFEKFWEVQGALDPFRETLLPNGCAELMVNLGPPHYLLHGTEKSVWEEAWFSGLHERSLIIESYQGTHLVSARLDALGAAELLGTRAADVANTVIDLDAFLGDAGRVLREAVRIAETPARRFAVLEEFLRNSDARCTAPIFVRHAVARIDATHGNLRVAALHEEAGVSRKHLAVTFRRWVGVSAKAYAGISGSSGRSSGSAKRWRPRWTGRNSPAKRVTLISRILHATFGASAPRVPRST